MGLSLLLPAGIGCARRAPAPCSDLAALHFSAAGDSLGLEDFLALDEVEQQSRRQEARRLAAQAAGEKRVDRQLQALNNAAGLAPDEPDYWLRLAHLWRWSGAYLQTDRCLTNAAAAVRELGPGSAAAEAHGPLDRDAAAVETALQRAWLHYDRAEWREGLPWVRAALRIEHGNEAALVIRGLLEAQLGRRSSADGIADDLRRKNAFSPNIFWILAILEGVEGRERNSFNNYTGLRPERRFAAECYRDMGRAAERLGQWAYAARWYRESVAAYPLPSPDCLTELAGPPLAASDRAQPLPFWVAFDEFYVTGSLSAYLAHAFDRFEAASEATAKERWGGLVVNAAGTCLRLDPADVQARRVRGLVYARTGRPDRSLADLQDALAELTRQGVSDALLEAELGHALLLLQDHQQAKSHLRRAVALSPDSAQAWSDLGLALIMSDERDEAAVALGRALELDAGLVAAWYNRGLMHLHAGDLAAAEADLAQAARLAPDNREVVALLQQVIRQARSQTTP